MREMNLREARARLGELAEAAHHGETITLTKHGRPYALLTPLKETAMTETTTYERTTDEGTDAIVIEVTGDEVRRRFLTDGAQTGEDHDTADRLHDYIVDIEADGYREI